MRSVIISSALFFILIIGISVNAYYVNSFSTDMLDIVFALPSEYNYIHTLKEKEIEKHKTEINKLASKWEKHSDRIELVCRYTDFDRVNSAVYSMKEYFFAGSYADYITARKKLIAGLEKLKHNELAIFKNIF